MAAIDKARRAALGTNEPQGGNKVVGQVLRGPGTRHPPGHRLTSMIKDHLTPAANPRADTRLLPGRGAYDADSKRII